MTPVKVVKLKLNEIVKIETQSLASAGYQTRISFTEGKFEVVNQTKQLNVNENPVDVVATDDIVIGSTNSEFFEIKALEVGHFIVEVMKERRFDKKAAIIFETYVIDVME